jgi:hypothetical protein
MPDTLPPLSTNTPCVKCGCTYATVQHQPARPLPVGARLVEPEHMARTCTRCGYAWRERPLDTLPVA